VVAAAGSDFQNAESRPQMELGQHQGDDDRGREARRGVGDIHGPPGRQRRGRLINDSKSLVGSVIVDDELSHVLGRPGLPGGSGPETIHVTMPWDRCHCVEDHPVLHPHAPEGLDHSVSKRHRPLVQGTHAEILALPVGLAQAGLDQVLGGRRVLRRALAGRWSLLWGSTPIHWRHADDIPSRGSN